MEQNIIKAIENMKLDFDTKLKEISSRFDNMESNLASSINQNIDEKFNNLNAEFDELKQESKEQEARIDYIEKHIRMRNLLIFGIKEEEKSYNELESLLIGIMKGNLDVELKQTEIEFVKRIGHKTQKSRPILFAVTTLGKKIEILKNKKKLNGTNTYIKEDFPKKIQELRNSLQPLLKQEIEQGNRAILKYDKLVVIGKNTQKRQLSQSPSQETSINESIKNSNATKEPKYKKTKPSEPHTSNNNYQRSILSYGSTTNKNSPRTSTEPIKKDHTMNYLKGPHPSPQNKSDKNNMSNTKSPITTSNN